MLHAWAISTNSPYNPRFKCWYITTFQYNLLPTNSGRYIWDFYLKFCTGHFLLHFLFYEKDVPDFISIAILLRYDYELKKKKIRDYTSNVIHLFLLHRCTRLFYILSNLIVIKDIIQKNSRINFICIRHYSIIIPLNNCIPKIFDFAIVIYQENEMFL